MDRFLEYAIIPCEITFGLHITDLKLEKGGKIIIITICFYKNMMIYIYIYLFSPLAMTNLPYNIHCQYYINGREPLYITHLVSFQFCFGHFKWTNLLWFYASFCKFCSPLMGAQFMWHWSNQLCKISRVKKACECNYRNMKVDWVHSAMETWWELGKNGMGTWNVDGKWVKWTFFLWVGS